MKPIRYEAQPNHGYLRNIMSVSLHTWSCITFTKLRSLRLIGGAVLVAVLAADLLSEAPPKRPNNCFLANHATVPKPMVPKKTMSSVSSIGEGLVMFYRMWVNGRQRLKYPKADVSGLMNRKKKKT